MAPRSGVESMVAVAMLTAEVPFVHRPISLFRHIPEFSKINPLLKAPTLVADDGTVLTDSGVILDYLGCVFPKIAALSPSAPALRLRAARAIGLGLTTMEKAVQLHYERALRPPEKRHEPWRARVAGQLDAAIGMFLAGNGILSTNINTDIAIPAGTAGDAAI